MDNLSILFIAIGLSMDAFAVAIVTSLTLKNVSKRQMFRLSFHCGFFQFLMPVLGWFLGASFSKYIQSFDHWIAFVLLSIIGGKMIYEAFEDDELPSENSTEKKLADPTRGFSLIFIAVATSIDAMAVGLSLAMLDINIWYPSVIIGVVTFSLTMLGMKIGEKVGKKFSSHMEVIGGLILIGIGIKILIEHIYKA